MKQQFFSPIANPGINLINNYNSVQYTKKSAADLHSTGTDLGSQQQQYYSVSREKKTPNYQNDIMNNFENGTNNNKKALKIENRPKKSQSFKEYQQKKQYENLIHEKLEKESNKKSSIVNYIQDMNGKNMKDSQKIQKLYQHYFQNQNVQILDLSFNKIGKIENFQKLTNLKVLILSNNCINRIENLSDFQSLEKLDLSYNEIQEISSQKFEKLQNLSYFDISNNQIQQIMELKTLKMCQKLKELNVKSNVFVENQSQVQEYVIKNLEQVQVLDGINLEIFEQVLPKQQQQPESESIQQESENSNIESKLVFNGLSQVDEVSEVQTPRLNNLNNNNENTVKNEQEKELMVNIEQIERQCRSYTQNFESNAQQFASFQQNYKELKSNFDDKIEHFQQISVESQSNHREILIEKISSYLSTLNNFLTNGNEYIMEYSNILNEFTDGLKLNERNPKTQNFSSMEVQPEIPQVKLGKIKKNQHEMEQLMVQILNIQSRLYQGADLQLIQNQKEEKINNCIQKIQKMFKEVNLFYFKVDQVFENLLDISQNLINFLVHLQHLVQAKLQLKQNKNQMEETSLFEQVSSYINQELTLNLSKIMQNQPSNVEEKAYDKKSQFKKVRTPFMSDLDSYVKELDKIKMENDLSELTIIQDEKREKFDKIEQNEIKQNQIQEIMIKKNSKCQKCVQKDSEMQKIQDYTELINKKIREIQRENDDLRERQKEMEKEKEGNDKKKEKENVIIKIDQDILYKILEQQDRLMQQNGSLFRIFENFVQNGKEQQQDQFKVEQNLHKLVDELMNQRRENVQKMDSIVKNLKNFQGQNGSKFEQFQEKIQEKTGKSYMNGNNNQQYLMKSEKLYRPKSYTVISERSYKRLNNDKQFFGGENNNNNINNSNNRNKNPIQNEEDIIKKDEKNSLSQFKDKLMNNIQKKLQQKQTYFQQYSEQQQSQSSQQQLQSVTPKGGNSKLRNFEHLSCKSTTAVIQGKIKTLQQFKSQNLEEKIVENQNYQSQQSQQQQRQDVMGESKEKKKSIEKYKSMHNFQNKYFQQSRYNNALGKTKSKGSFHQTQQHHLSNKSISKDLQISVQSTQNKPDSSSKLRVLSPDYNSNSIIKDHISSISQFDNLSNKNQEQQQRFHSTQKQRNQSLNSQMQKKQLQQQQQQQFQIQQQQQQQQGTKDYEKSPQNNSFFNTSLRQGQENRSPVDRFINDSVMKNIQDNQGQMVGMVQKIQQNVLKDKSNQKHRNTSSNYSSSIQSNNNNNNNNSFIESLKAKLHVGSQQQQQQKQYRNGYNCGKVDMKY